MQQFQMPDLSKTNKFLLIALGASFILNSIATHTLKIPLVNILGLSSTAFFSGYIFQLVTYPFASIQLMDVVFTGLLLWFLGSELERIWGALKYKTFLALTCIVTGVVYIVFTSFLSSSAAAYPLHGMNVFSSAMCVAYAVLFPDRIFQFFMLIPLKAKYFCMILAGMSLYSGFFSPGAALAIGNLVAMGIGFIFVKFAHFLPEKLLGARQPKKSTSRAKLHIVKDEEKKEPRYFQ